jgi:hypothetical protein
MSGIKKERKGRIRVEPVKTPAISSNGRIKKDGKLDRNSEIQTEWGNTPEVFKPTGATKAKPKTRGELSSIGRDFEELKSEDTQEAPAKAPVKKSAFGVFSNLFPRRGG